LEFFERAVSLMTLLDVIIKELPMLKWHMLLELRLGAKHSLETHPINRGT